jgi:hypothetical protein
MTLFLLGLIGFFSLDSNEIKQLKNLPRNISMSRSTNPRVELAKAINTLVTKQEMFTKAYDSLQNFSQDTLKSLDMEIEVKNTELKELELTSETTKKNLQIETDQYIAEYKYEAAKKILLSREEIAINREDYETLKGQTDSMKERHDRELSELRQSLSGRHKKELERELTTRDLMHAASQAGVNARVEQQTKEIENLNNTILNLKEEIAAQRKLTAQVAESSRPQARFDYNNNNGK